MKLHTEYADYNVICKRGKYMDDSLAIVLIEQDTDEEIGMLTVNLQDIILPNQAYIDTNNFPEAEQFIKDNDLGEPTGLKRQSGFCEYPLYNLNIWDMPEMEQ